MILYNLVQTKSETVYTYLISGGKEGYCHKENVMKIPQDDTRLSFGGGGGGGCWGGRGGVFAH